MKVQNVMIKSIIVNLFLSIMKVLFGVFAKSKALIADGVHSFSDLSTDIVAIIGNKLASKEPDLKHPYGHGKLEYLTSIIISLIIVVLGITLIKSSFESTNNSFSIIVVIVSIITIIIKLLLSNYILKKGIEYKNSILIASGNESKSDVISSLVVLVSSIFMYFGKYIKIFTFADMIASIIVGIFIIRIGIIILSENISTIIGEQETDTEYLKDIKDIIKKSELIKEIDSLVLIKLGCYYELTCDVSMDEDIKIKDAHNELEKIENMLKEYDPKIKYQTIHINPYKRITDE